MGKTQPLLIFNQRYLDFRHESSESRGQQTSDTLKYLLRSDAIEGGEKSKLIIGDKLPEEFLQPHERNENPERAIMLNYGAYRPGSTGAFNQTGVLDQQQIHAVKQAMQAYRGLQWNAVFSLPDFETAARLDLTSHADYQRLFTKILPKYFAKNKLDPQNMHWIAMYHINTQHPHCHILFWEREATKNRGNFAKGFERTFKQLVAQELNLYHEVKTELWQIDQFEKQIRADLAATMQKPNFWLEDQLQNLMTQLPRTGRIQYQSQNCEAIRPSVDAVIHYLLQTELRASYHDYRVTCQKVTAFETKLYGENEATLGTRKEQELFERLGNALLREAQSIRDEIQLTQKRDTFPDLLQQSFANTTHQRQLKLELFLRLAKELAFAEQQVQDTLQQQFQLTEQEREHCQRLWHKQLKPLTSAEVEQLQRFLQLQARQLEPSITEKYLWNQRRYRLLKVNQVLNRLASALKKAHYQEQEQAAKREAEIAAQFTTYYEQGAR